MENLNLVLLGTFGPQRRILLGLEGSVIKLISLIPNETKKFNIIARTHGLTNGIIPLLVQEEGLLVISSGIKRFKFWYYASGKEIRINFLEEDEIVVKFQYNRKTKKILIFSHTDWRTHKDYENAKSFIHIYDLNGKENRIITLPIGSRDIAIAGDFLAISKSKTRQFSASIELRSSDTYEVLGYIQTEEDPLHLLAREKEEGIELISAGYKTKIYSVKISKRVEVEVENLEDPIEQPKFFLDIYYVIKSEFRYDLDYSDPPAHYLIRLPSNNFVSEGFNKNEVLLINEKKVYLVLPDYLKQPNYDVTQLLTVREKIKFAFTLPFTKKDYQSLYCLLKIRLRRYLPLDLIKFSFDLLGFESEISLSPVKGGF